MEYFMVDDEGGEVSLKKSLVLDPQGRTVYDVRYHSELARLYPVPLLSDIAAFTFLVDYRDSPSTRLPIHNRLINHIVRNLITCG